MTVRPRLAFSSLVARSAHTIFGAEAIKQNDKESIGQHLIVRRMVVLMMCIAVHCAASANRAKVSFTLIESAGLLDGQSHQH